MFVTDVARAVPFNNIFASLLLPPSQPAEIGNVDAFVTHSWHDDSELKWDVLQRWRHDFKREHKREPRVWLDKYCIKQSELSTSLMCLPVRVGLAYYY